MNKIYISSKFNKIRVQTPFHALDPKSQEQVQKLALDNLFTLQELKKTVESVLDFNMWEEKSFISYWDGWRSESNLKGREFKKLAFKNLDTLLNDFKKRGVIFKTNVPPLKPKDLNTSRIEITKENSENKIYGECPVQSEKTICCNLKTIDAVKNCGFGCSYCSIQTMYKHGKVQFDDNFKEKLNNIKLDPQKKYHIGTGQSSDALMWGNTNGVLSDMFEFSKKWPNAIVEFKTKSKNIKHFLKTEVPKNIFCTWSLNPDEVILNEEHLTASFSERIGAARKLADKGVIVGFHFHPMVHFVGWEKSYKNIIQQVLDQFSSSEVGMVSFGALTYPKPIIKKIRGYSIKSKILQMPMVANPEGKMTYPSEIKNQMFKLGFDSFKPWHKKVFFYLCMEEAKYWQSTMGYVYKSNVEFEKALIDSVQDKMSRLTPKMN